MSAGARAARRHVRRADGGAATRTGEIYDLVIVGGGFSGTVAAYTFLKETGRQRTCLLLDNHPIIGGEAKRNEFMVRGQRLIGPQGSNEGDPPERATGPVDESMWRDVGTATGVRVRAAGARTASQ